MGTENEKAAYKGLVAFDLDNTLLDHNTWKIPDSALAGIRLLKRAHYLVVIASGRNMHDRNSSQYLEIIRPDALVHMNGTRVEIGEETIRDHQMDREILQRLLDYASKHTLAVGVRIGETDYFTYPEKVIEHDLKYWGKSERNFGDPCQLLKLQVRALAYAGGKDGADELQHAFPELQVLMFSKETGADIFEKGFSKADGIAVLCEHFGIPMEKTFAFGDSHNDREMLEKIQVGIAMGNAVPEIREVADYITDDIDQDGIYNALKHFGLINGEEAKSFVSTPEPYAAGIVSGT